jgi:hypothetical protein
MMGAPCFLNFDTIQCSTLLIPRASRSYAPGPGKALVLLLNDEYNAVRGLSEYFSAEC